MTARTAIPVHQVGRGGLDLATLTPTAGDATNFNSIANSGKMWFAVHNTDSSSHPFTILFPHAVDGQAVTPVSHTIAAGATIEYGDYDPNVYGGTLEINPASAMLTFLAKTQ